MFKNKYIIKDDYAIVYYKNRNKQEFEILIDLDDFKNLYQTSTGFNVLLKEGNRKYVRINGFNSKFVLLHRFIMDCPEDKIVDHINHNTLDNRKSNLKVVTVSENAQNIKLRKNSKSGIKNVCWVKEVNKWKASLKLNGKTIILGYFDNIKDAEKAAIEGRKKYFTNSYN